MEQSDAIACFKLLRSLSPATALNDCLPPTAMTNISSSSKIVSVDLQGTATVSFAGCDDM